MRLRNGSIDTVAENNGLNVPIRLRNFVAWHYPNGRLWWHGIETDSDIVEILTNSKPEMDTTTFPFSWGCHLGTLESSDFTFRDPAKITINDKRFTPADSWPEPITDRLPTEEDANEDGDVQFLDSDGDWIRYPWNTPDIDLGWARTSDWKPRPIDKKTLTIRDLKEAMRDGENPDHDTLRSAIELLEATL